MSKIENIINELKTLTLLETVELVKTIETIFGIDTTIPVIPTSLVTSTNNPLENQSSQLSQKEEKTTFDIILVEVPADKKIAILKIVRTITGFGLKESKDIVDNVPKIVKESVSKDEADNIKKELEDAGAKVQLK